MVPAPSIGKWALAVLLLFSSCNGRSVADPVAPVSAADTTRPVLPDPGDLLTDYLSEPASVDLSALVAALDPVLSDRAELPSLLHQAAGFDGQSAGRKEIAVPIGFNQNRRVIVRTPEGYDPNEPWPLLVAYHVWGGSADRIIDRMERLLGPAVDDYVIAAPDDYRQTIVDAPPPVTSEHVSVWRGVKALWNIDSDRVYLAGYSLGGETTMTMATLHPGEIAGAVAMAAGYSFPSDVAGMWEEFLPNLRAVPVFHIWGAEDDLNIAGLNGRDSTDTLALQNERLDSLLQPIGLDLYRHLRLDGTGHSDAQPETGDLVEFLIPPRPAPPTTIDQTFRYIHQANAYWVEGHEWEGPAWDTPWPEAVASPGETEEEALARTILGLMGEIHATIEGQTIRIEATHLSDLTIWLSDGMIDWALPVTVYLGDQRVFSDIITPDMGVALAQATRTLDFDRLRWAGIRLDVPDAVAQVVDAEDVFPPILREITLG